MLLEELAKKEKLNVDFHNHLQTGPFFRTKPKSFREWFKNLFLEEGFSNLTGILDKVMKTKLDVLYLTNFGDETRYEDWTSREQIKAAIDAGYKIEIGEYYVFAKKGEKVIAIGKSQEVPTLQGHALFAGLRRNKRFTNNKSLDETLAEARDGELKIADHPYVAVQRMGILRSSIKDYKNKRKIKGEVKQVEGKPIKLTTYIIQNSIKNYTKDIIKKFDTLEQNGNFSFANWRARRVAGYYNKPILSNPDGHHPKDIGKTYNTFDSKDLIYTSERVFRDSINYNVRERKFETTFRPIPIYRIFHHALMIGLNKLFGRKYKS
jgi:hypothetical protein